MSAAPEITEIVEVCALRNRKLANELLARGYVLLSVATVHWDDKRENPHVPVRRSHEFVLGRTANQRPFAELLEEKAAS